MKLIVSHRYRFIFVKTRKTAGTSIEVYLAKHCGPEDVVSKVKPAERDHEPRNYRGFWNPLPEIAATGGRLALRSSLQWIRRRRYLGMLPAYVLRCRVPRSVWDGYYKFCVERNPWDKAVSAYWFRSRQRGFEGTFNEFLESSRLAALSDHATYTDPHSGELLVDRVLRFESLEQELGEVFEKLGVPWSGSLGVKAKGGYRSDRRPYAEQYDEAGKRRVAEVFSREIDLLGYEF